MIPTIHAVVVQAIPGKPLVKQMEVAVNRVRTQPDGSERDLSPHSEASLENPPFQSCPFHRAFASQKTLSIAETQKLLYVFGKLPERYP